jgi:fatty acid desaturase
MNSPTLAEAGPGAERVDSGQLREKGASNDIPLSLKATLVDDRGVSYRDFRRGLKPRWPRVWLELTAGYVVVAATLAALVLGKPAWPLTLPATLAGALVIGYAIHFINCFFHEAAHYNVVPGRRLNDLVTNLTMGWMFGSSIAMYRRIHFQHHRALGTTADSENSYFDALRIRYLAQGLVGLKLLRTLRQNRETETSQGRSARGAPVGGQRLASLFCSAVVNLAIVGALLLLGSPAAAIAWIGGLLIVFPFMASLRQLLEHRSEEADPNTDYHAVDHGPVNRLFGSGPLASTVGSAGFNRHAIHHWEPQLSYTRLADVEGYLLHTEVAPLIRERQTSYADTFLRLLEL